MKVIKEIIILLSGSALLFGGCTQHTESPPSTIAPTISQNKAIAIAATQVPIEVINPAEIDVTLLGSVWRVIFYNANVTKRELGWQESSDTQFDREGAYKNAVPEGAYKSVMVTVDATTGNILRRLATNGIFLAGPVPPPTTTVR
jgi:hypothetical protein